MDDDNEDDSTHGGSGDNDADQEELDEVLSRVSFPATRDELVEAARDHEATDSVINLFEKLPDDEYGNRNEVKQALESRQSGRGDGSEDGGM